MAIAWDVAELPFFLASAVSLALATTLLVYDPRGKRSRLFAAFLYLRSLGDIGLALGAMSTTAGAAVAFNRIAWYLLIAQVPVLLVFLMHYPSKQDWVRPWMHVAVAAPFALALLLYSINMRWWGTLRFDGGLIATFDGWLSWMTVAVFFAPLAAAVLLLLDLRRREPGPQREVLRLLTIGFWWQALHTSGVFILVLVAQGVPAAGAGNAAWVDFVTNLTQVLGLAFALGLAVAIAVADRRNRSMGIRFASFGMVVAGISFFTIGWSAGLWGLDPGRWFDLVADALAYAALPFLATYALLKHKMFDIDLRVKFVLGKSTFASIVGGAFWLLTTVISEIIEPQGVWPAVIAGAVVAIALKPIHILATRFADRVMPHAKPLDDMGDDERRRLYEEQVHLAWTDRAIREKERRILDNLRSRLRIPAAEAESIEKRIMQDA